MTYIEKKRSILFGLPLYFTTYTINENKLTIQSGFLTITEDDAYMYKIQDVRLTRGFFERIFGLGTIICYTGDTTHPELRITRVKHSVDIKDYILLASEEARRKRRTIHSLDIDANETTEE
ncbi:PH (Pleckstrin Homology) domain-containing protein [Mobilisporobacter senegalensis]|uniref:PH (Pleckstrin Homology) domain-containing protein n=1 Tax=Mobilisporobacter senegalensis TaxID=1329262 RepID=A0A3N1XK17_9FIRM|nr:PH domain-containing protein [Mobilisporobacter senegalensis]ROR27090.1 PH (Pleckstrin Homology) domain-containing protein [Mobilisporobacter senegalensis]